MVSLRELFLIIRAEDHASKQLRMVGGSLRGLAKASDVAAASARLQAQSSAMASTIAARQAKIDMFPKEQQMAMEKRGMLEMKAMQAGQALQTFQTERAASEAALAQGISAKSAKLKENINLVDKNGNALRGVIKANKLAAQSAIIDGAAQADLAAGMQKLNAEETRLSMSAMQANHALGKQDLAMEKAAVANTALADSQVVARQRMADFNTEMDRFNRTAPKIARLERIRHAAMGAAAFGRTAMFGGFIGAGALGFAANAAANLQTQSTLAATQAAKNINQVGIRTKQVEDGILASMQRFPASATEMSKSIYDIFSGTNVQQARQGIALMNIFNQAAVAGQSDLNTATQGGITVMNAYNKSVKDMVPIEQKMFAAVRFGRTNFTDFNNSLNQLVPAFKSANQSINVMFGSLAFLTRRMPSVRMASTSLARATEILSNSKMVAGLKKVGVSIADIHGNLKPLPQVIGAILQKFPALAKGKNVMTWIKDISGQQGTIQARRALTFLFRQFPQYQQMLRQVSGDTNEFTRSYRALAASPAVKFRVAINQFKALALTIGKDAIPAIISLLKPLSAAMRYFHGLSPAVKSSIATFLVWAAAISLVGGALLVFTANVVNAAATLGLLVVASNAAVWFGDLAAGVRLVAGALAAGNFAEGFGLMAASLAALGPALPIALLFAAGAAMVYFSDRVKPVSQQVDDLAKSLGKIKDPLKQFKDMNKVMQNTTNLTGTLTDKTKAAQDALASGAEGTKGRGAQGLRQTIHDSGIEMKRLNGLTDKEVSLLAQAAEKARETNQHLNKQQLSIGGAGLAASAGLTAAQQNMVGFMSRQAGALPSSKLLARFQEFGDKAIGIASTVAASTHKMISGKELDQALGLSQSKLQKLYTFVAKHHKLPKWLLQIDVKKAIKDTGKVHQDAAKLARQHFKVSFQDGTGPARKGISKTRADALAVAQKKYAIRFAIDTAGVTTALGTLVSQAETAGQNIASALNNGFTKKQKVGSPSKVWMQYGRWLIQGLSKGIVKEAGGAKAAMKTIIDAMNEAWQGFHDQLQGSFGTLFGGPRADIISNMMGFGAKPPMSLLTADLRGQVHKFSQWIHALRRLQGKIPPQLYLQLLELGPDSLPAVQTLASASKKDLRTYKRLFKQEQNLINQGTRQAFKAQSDIWKGMGKQVAFGVLTGLRSEKPQLIKFFREVAREIFGGHHRHHHGGGGGGSHVHYHYHAPAYVGGPSHAAHMRRSRFDYEKHIKRLPK